MRVRFRLDGMLYEVMKPPIRFKNAIVSRIKIMSKSTSPNVDYRRTAASS